MIYLNVDGKDKWVACDTIKMVAQMLDKSILESRLAEVTAELENLPTKEELDEARMKFEQAGLLIVSPSDYGFIEILENEKKEISNHITEIEKASK